MKIILSLACACMILVSCQKQLEPVPLQPDTNKSNDQLRPQEDGKLVRVLYIIPQDRQLNRSYEHAIRKTAGIIQRWYKEQMDGLSYPVTRPVVETFQSDKTAAWFGANNGGISGTDPFFYNFWNTFTEMQNLVGPSWYDPANTIYMVYIDAYGQTGAGFSGFCVLPEHDLMGIAGLDDNPPIQWTGGQAHELGHAFGLPHPDGSAYWNETLMGAGYIGFPDTYLLESDKQTLLASGFFQ